MTIWGSKGIGEGQFTTPAGLALDKQGNLYVTDRATAFVQKFDHSGKFLAKWGGKGSGDGQFSDPLGIAVDEQGNVFVGDSTGDTIQKIRPYREICG